ncbi:MAG: hypothetical protein KA436_07020 [Oligoflexales bacterium]|nr:hypothetical protein [Oligoflexales bacterium]
MRRRFAKHTLIALMSFLIISKLAADTVEDFSSQVLVPEIISSSKSPMVYDWRKSSFSLELGLVQFHEKNSFKGGDFDYALMGMIPTLEGQIFRFGIRRIEVLETPSTRLIGRTPFKQTASVSRYEVFGQWGFSLMEGRSISRISFLPSLETVLWGLVGAHLSQPSRTWVPKLKGRSEPYPGQNAVNSTFVVELAVLWQVYLPNRIGFFVEGVYNIPIRDMADLSSWSYTVIGLSYSSQD